jgi:hypothetical protein
VSDRRCGVDSVSPQLRQGTRNHPHQAQKSDFVTLAPVNKARHLIDGGTRLLKFAVRATAFLFDSNIWIMYFVFLEGFEQ